MMTGYLTHPRHIAHDMPDHPEHAGRLIQIEAALAAAGLHDRLYCQLSLPASEEDLLRVHTSEYLALLADVSQRGRHVLFGSDTYVTPDSYQVARLAAGAAIQAAAAVASGKADNGLVAVRPPGHHALPSKAMGFCLLANVALAARYLQEMHRCERILIVDYDVHHGNGTQDIFYDDPGVLFISIHQSPLYPGTGRLEEIGFGLGEGTTLNIPLRPGYGDAAYARVFDEIVWPAARRFRPEMILVSAGFDAHWDDPLASMTLTLTGFDRMTRALIGMAAELCGGRIVFMLEGGYSLGAVGPAVCNVAFALLGDETVNDPLPLPDRVPEIQARLPDIGPLIQQVHAVHGLEG